MQYIILFDLDGTLIDSTQFMRGFALPLGILARLFPHIKMLHNISDIR